MTCCKTEFSQEFQGPRKIRILPTHCIQPTCARSFRATEIQNIALLALLIPLRQDPSPTGHQPELPEANITMPTPLVGSGHRGECQSHPENTPAGVTETCRWYTISESPSSFDMKMFKCTEQEREYSRELP